MKIIVDAMGGDNAPSATVRGALQANREFGHDIILVGRGEEILKVLNEDGLGQLPSGIEIAHADQVVDNHDNPATAFREKKDSSLTIGLKMLKDGGGDAFVSAGSTGAILSAATLLVKRIRGIRRAALCPVVPNGKGGSVLIDCGANAECTAEFLLQFAFMGSYYAGHVLGRPEPRVGLLNIGGEESKGDGLRKAAFDLLKQAGDEGRINFTGNVEGREAVAGEVDVIVADGFAGNVFLKTVEGTGMFLAGEIKKMFKKSWKSKLGALLVQDGIADFKKLLDYREVGGTALIGISKPVIKAHGSSDAYAIRSAIRQAGQVASSGIIDDISAHIDEMKVSVHKEGGETEE